MPKFAELHENLKFKTKLIFTASRKAHKPSNATKTRHKQLILNILRFNKTIKQTTNKNAPEKFPRRFLL